MLISGIAVSPSQVLLACGGAMALLVGWVVWKILSNLHLNLYLLNHDSLVEDQVIIPVTTTGHKKSQWFEDISIQLSDGAGQTHQLSFTYNFWKGFCINAAQSPDIAIDEKPLRPEGRHAIRTGMKLRINDRQFEFLVTPKQLFSKFPNEFRL